MHNHHTLVAQTKTDATCVEPTAENTVCQPATTIVTIQLDRADKN